MRYFKIVENDKLIIVGTGVGGIEISESEYDDLIREIDAKIKFADKLYHNEITIDEVPEEWREDIIRRVDERIEADSMEPEPDIFDAINDLTTRLENVENTIVNS